MSEITVRKWYHTIKPNDKNRMRQMRDGGKRDEKLKAIHDCQTPLETGLTKHRLPAWIGRRWNLGKRIPIGKAGEN